MLFKCKYLGLGVNHEGKTIQFKNGEYETSDKKEIATLKNILDVAEVVETKE